MGGAKGDAKKSISRSAETRSTSELSSLGDPQPAHSRRRKKKNQKAGGTQSIVFSPVII